MTDRADIECDIAIVGGGLAGGLAALATMAGGKSRAVVTDVAASNGVIHAIDAVAMP
jgi:succinate dehydrogenase/fumarate reductase flavoprotein subunit